ncbi:TPA: hypothetical protein EYP70_00195 [Candidatus Bathyarchaeota archaeon]|nr:hypothetical protein [Candidatus Bathyarchaeota archaeon]
MDIERLYLIALMDCERVGRYAPDMGGPETWERSEKAIEGWASLLSSRGFRGFFGVHPETAIQHHEIFRQLAKEGFEIGLQFHAGNFRALEYRCYLGSYDREKQFEIISKAREDWIRALDMIPKTYGIGGGSFNDYTWLILYELGFRQCYVPPERHRLDVHCITIGMYPYPHHANSYNRLIPGDLELYVVPTTINWRRKMPHVNQFYDLRPEGGLSLDIHRETIEQNIKKMVELKVPIKTILVPTHNTQAYENPKNKSRVILEKILDFVESAAEERGLRLVSATFEEVHLAAHGGEWPWIKEEKLYHKWERMLRPGEGFDVRVIPPPNR